MLTTIPVIAGLNEHNQAEFITDVEETPEPNLIAQVDGSTPENKTGDRRLAMSVLLVADATGVEYPAAACLAASTLA